MANCTDGDAQYASAKECAALCKHLPVGDATHDEAEKNTATLACRQYWADAPARTSPESYCLAAGPFGGNVCGDRCTAFCDILLSTCPGDAGVDTYDSKEACMTSCTYFAYRDAGADGGGEGPDGPTEGDTFNCRLYWLRAATMDSAHCAELAPNSNTCSDGK
jgi:hypothetical protein